MKRKHPNTIPMEEMTQDLLDKAYSCEMSKEQLLKMFSDCIEKKWMEEEENFRKKVEVYLQKNQGNIESYEADFYDSRFGYEDARNIYSKFKIEFDLSQRYKFYLEIICAMYKLHRNMNYGIDMRKVPIVIYPTLHYQNGGLEINGDGFTKEIPNLLVAGEAAGGIHGTNRLMGNSLLDVIVFGRNAGKKAAAKCKDVELGKLNLDHIYHYENELEQADIHTGKMSPMLLPNYARHER